MSKVSGCLWLAVGLILALVAGGVAFVTLQRATAAKSQAGPAETTPVVVAAHPIQAGALLTESDLTVQPLPANVLPAGALTSIADASGQITMVPLDTGEMVLAHHLTQPDITINNLGFTLPEGQVAVTLSADDLLSGAQIIQPGSHVDILYSLDIPGLAQSSDQSNAILTAQTAQWTGEKQLYTFGTLQDVTIVGVLRGGGAEKTGASSGMFTGGSAPVLGGTYAYILALDTQDALALKYLRDAGAVMDLALRNVADDTEHEAQPVDLLYLIDKYQLPVR